MATEQDAARDRVLAARAELDEEIQRLEASARAAVDVRARIRRSPAKTAAIAGGAGFLLLKGPQRTFGLVKRIVRGPAAPMPKALLPDEIDKTLRGMGDDGERVRRVLERDFAMYVKKAEKQRVTLRTILTVAVARPLLLRASKAAVEAFLTPDQGDVAQRLERIRARAQRGLDAARADARPEPGPAGDESPRG